MPRINSTFYKAETVPYLSILAIQLSSGWLSRSLSILVSASNTETGDKSAQVGIGSCVFLTGVTQLGRSNDYLPGRFLPEHSVEDVSAEALKISDARRNLGHPLQHLDSSERVSFLLQKI